MEFCFRRYCSIYEALKNAVSSKKLDTSKDIVIATDAAKYGIGGYVFKNLRTLLQSFAED